MKNLFNRIAIIVAICAMASTASLATTTTRNVTFTRTITVNGTPVKAGTYKVTFDDQTGAFTILNGKKIVAKATARLEKVKGTYQGAYSIGGVNSDLVSMNMNGNSQAVIVNDGVMNEKITP